MYGQVSYIYRQRLMSFLRIMLPTTYIRSPAPPAIPVWIQVFRKKASISPGVPLLSMSFTPDLPPIVPTRPGDAVPLGCVAELLGDTCLMALDDPPTLFPQLEQNFAPGANGFPQPVQKLLAPVLG